MLFVGSIYVHLASKLYLACKVQSSLTETFFPEKGPSSGSFVQISLQHPKAFPWLQACWCKELPSNRERNEQHYQGNLNNRLCGQVFLGTLWGGMCEVICGISTLTGTFKAPWAVVNPKGTWESRTMDCRTVSHLLGDRKFVSLPLIAFLYNCETLNLLSVQLLRLFFFFFFVNENRWVN